MLQSGDGALNESLFDLWPSSQGPVHRPLHAAHPLIRVARWCFTFTPCTLPLLRTVDGCNIPTIIQSSMSRLSDHR